MKKSILLILLALTTVALGAADSAIWGDNLIPDILGYNKEGSLKLGFYFTLLQSTYFKPIFLGVLLGVPALFLLHYLIIGPMIFSHDRKKKSMYLLCLTESYIQLLQLPSC